MSQTAHHLLAKVSEHKRDAEGEILNQLTTYRATLVAKMAAAKKEYSNLQTQQGQMMEHGSEATELMMLEISLGEKQHVIHDILNEMEVLDVAIGQQRKKWADEHKKSKAHEKMFHDIKSVSQRKQAQKQQKKLDDQYSSKLFAGHGV